MGEIHTGTAFLVAAHVSRDEAQSDFPELADRWNRAQAMLVAEAERRGLTIPTGEAAEPSDDDVEEVLSILDGFALQVGINDPVLGQAGPLRALGAFVARLGPLVRRYWPVVVGFGRAFAAFASKQFPRLLRGLKGAWRGIGGKWGLIAGGVVLGAEWLQQQLERLGRGATTLAFGLGSLGLVLFVAYLFFSSKGGNDDG